MNETELSKSFEKRVIARNGKVLPSSAEGVPTARVHASDLIDLLASLKEGPGICCDMLIDLCAVDEFPKEPRFDVIYHLRCLETGETVRIKSFAQGDKHEIPSVTHIYGTADWHEREAFDMMGIRFTGHPDLKRILMPAEFEHHCLRKDFPLTGIEPDKLYKERFPEKSAGSMHQKRTGEGREDR